MLWTSSNTQALRIEQAVSEIELTIGTIIESGFDGNNSYHTKMIM